MAWGTHGSEVGRGAVGAGRREVSTPARTRRAATIGEMGLTTLSEDVNVPASSSDESGDCLFDGVDGSPCPPPTARATAPNAMAMAMLNAKRISAGSGRAPLQRAQTYAQI